ncbi:MAG: hypothetical protein GY863_19380 [bacterium]|nr:hypothetical protein [bacterium]
MLNNKRIISILTVFSLFLIIACGGGGDTGGSGESSSDTGSSNRTNTLLSLLPADNAVTGWTKDADSEPRFFGPGNLWEFINGAADGYLIYDFQEVVTVDFIHGPSDNQAVLDIYNMDTPLNAYGIYAQERNPSYNFNEIGVEGYVGGTSVNFWDGQYYVKITVFEESDELKQDLQELAGKIAENIQYTDGVPAQIGYFPEKDQVMNTVKYLPHDVLGQSFLKNGFESQYSINGNDFKILYMTMENENEAVNGLARYKEFVGSGGNVSKDITSPGNGGFVGEDSFYGSMMAVRSGSNIICILGMPSERYGTTAVTELISKIQ